MAQSTNRFLALADSPSRSRDKPDNPETISMPERVYFPKAVPETFQAIREVNPMIKPTGLEKTRIELVKARAPRINGRAFCLGTHTRDARKHGETEQPLYLLSAWRGRQSHARGRTLKRSAETLSQQPMRNSGRGAHR
jgi:AhpD family alkylhydroperoxidase